MVVGISCGLLSGYISWPEPGATSDMMFSAVGAIIGSVLIVIVVAGTIELIRQEVKWPWLPVAVSITGSWMAAIAVLLGALMFRSVS
jgi:hypothetical protein